jgi:NodT family efflux transporter outer membrane factor (OMF) lipoprotein
LLRPSAILAVVIAAFATACKTVGPDYRAPEASTPPAYAEPAAAGRQADLSKWWRGFDDPLMTRLVEAALAQNLDLAQAVSRIAEARRQETVAGARDGPQVSAEAQASRNRISENAIPIPPGSGTPGGLFGLPGSEFDTFRVGLDASWEIDLFGGTRRAVEGARARTEAAEWTARDLQVSLAAEVAHDYVALRGLQRREAVARRDLDRQSGLLSIAASRADTGFTSRFEAEQQASLKQGTAARIPALQARQKALIHALGVLTGQEPGTLLAELSPPAPMPVAAAPPPGLPSELLRRRPDIRGAERKAAAASADIGVATAELYPKFSLTAQPAFVSTELSSLLDWGSRNYSIGAGLVWPLFNGGRIKAQVGAAGEHQAQAVLAWRQSVLVAMRDVEDALARYAADSARAAELKRAASSARAAAAIAADRYRGGVADYTPVFTAEGQLNASEDELAQAEQAMAEDVVALIKALGGGWDQTLTESRS